jgi:hypothetical protein
MSDSLDFDKIPIRDYSVAHTPIPKKNNKSKIVILLAVITLIVAGVIFVLGSSSKKKTKTTNVTPTVQTTNTTPAKVEAATPYSSAYYNLTFNLPSGWNVVNDNKQSLTAQSAITNLVDVSGKSFNGRLVLSVTPTGQPPVGLKGKDATAVVQSEKISYTQPTANQLAQSYISLVQYQSTVSKAGLDAIIVTGNSGYTEAQIVPFSKLNALNPTIVIYFQSCSESKCLNPTNMSINSSMWSDSNFKALIENLLKSFSLS